MNAEQYAIIDEAAGHLVNTVLWDGDTSKWQPPAGTRAELLANVDVAALPPAPAPEGEKITAEQHLESVGLGGSRQPTLIYLKLQLQTAGKSSPKLAAVENYLNAILASYAQDPSPRSDWPQPVVSFEDAVAEAVQLLQ